MQANLWNSLTMRFMALGRSLHEAECIAAVIVIDCLVISTIMGYRSRDAEREHSPAVDSGPETCPMTLQGRCGTVPEGVERDGIFLPWTLDPARPDSRGKQSGVTDLKSISAIMRNAAMVCW